MDNFINFDLRMYFEKLLFCKLFNSIIFFDNVLKYVNCRLIVRVLKWMKNYLICVNFIVYFWFNINIIIFLIL